MGNALGERKLPVVYRGSGARQGSTWVQRHGPPIQGGTGTAGRPWRHPDNVTRSLNLDL